MLTRVTSGAPPGGGGALVSLAHAIRLQFQCYISFDGLILILAIDVFLSYLKYGDFKLRQWTLTQD